MDADGPRASGALVLRTRLAEQVAELHTRAAQALTGDPEGVHRTRVASRRLRSALGTFRPLLDRQVTDPLRDELRWLGRALAPARDTEVVRLRLTALLDEEPAVEASARADAEARRRLEETLTGQAREAGVEADEALTSARFTDLVAALDRLVAEPPFAGKASSPAEDVLPRLVRRDWKRLRRALAAVPAAGDGAGAGTDEGAHDAAIHEVRKDAKRLRYAAESLVPLWGDEAESLVVAAKRLTTHLGERQDAVTSLQHVRRLADQADAAGESSAPWGALRAVELRRTADLDAALEELWTEVSDKRHRRFLG
ncbi:CHAD domain-containing protein [Nocardioides sp. GCM10027113]|uniref:CHAD domain-containing protein n=1 Tax=unclassified Nocardioides TaxID=2615069 RepID=UPI00360E43CA